jgi:3-deoxy-manno-octulosonate cytidylyltransferase (CMP-KDO synthetase)
MSIYGFVPARMAASRFPGKPLHKICDRPMIEHVFCRASFYDKWDGLFLTTCDEEIEAFGKKKDYPVIMTRSDHTRCLDRVAEAVTKCGKEVLDNDIIMCVQGDEPMLHPDMIDATIKPMEANSGIPGTILAMEIVNREQFENPDIVKLIFNDRNEILYTSRMPIPYCNGQFSREHGARRIFGIFGFRWWFLRDFVEMSEGRLERLESCDSNRFLDSPNRQYISPYPFRPSYSVDSPEDIKRVEENLIKDELWGKY